MGTKQSMSMSRRRADHLRLLEELDDLALTDSCCEICHCDCYSSHRSTDDISYRAKDERKFYLPDVFSCTQISNCDTSSQAKPKLPKLASSSKEHKSKKDSTHKSSKKRRKSASKPPTPTPSRNSKSAKATPPSKSPAGDQERALVRHRSKSASSIHSPPRCPTATAKHFTRDCELLQDLLGSLDAESAAVLTQTQSKSFDSQVMHKSKEKPENAHKHRVAQLKLCASMANLCLEPTVKQAFQQVPTHDKKILNRMATKRSERRLAKENAWLARKYWENERYERELLKCEQMEEYKRAIRDKQFQDYLMTKARLNELAQRDLAELQRLRMSLQEKDQRTKQRLNTIRNERDILLCQRRCDELRKSEAVNLQQEEQQLDAKLRKHESYQRLNDRLQRADQLRSQMLDGYLKRLRYDNYIEQVLHEEHWADAQRYELLKREQLKEHISRKRSKSQRFVEQRQRRNEAMAHTAKISASLRELVRSSVTPDGEGAFVGVEPSNLGRLLLGGSLTKLAM